MPITFVVVMSTTSWQWMASQLLVSVLAVMSVYQDLKLRIRLGVVFWFLIALIFGISAMVTAIRSNVRFGPAICVIVLCLETLSILHRIVRQHNSKSSQ